MAVGEVHIVTIGIGALSNATRPLFPVPSAGDGGGIKILEAHVVAGGSIDSSLRLLKGTVAGGTFTVNGTIDSAAIGGTAAPFAANVIKSWTISTPYVSADEWVAVIEGNAGAAHVVTLVEVSYVLGK